MNALKELQDRLSKLLPESSMEYDPSETETGSSWLEVKFDDQEITIEWIPNRGFGLYTSRDNSFGSAPDELYRDGDLLLRRINMLKNEGREEIGLGRLRELIGMTQEDLSDILNQRQSSISKLENRDDYQLSTIHRFVSALGGRLEVKVHFDNFDLPIYYHGPLSKRSLGLSGLGAEDVAG